MQSLIKDINLAAEGRKKIDWVSNFMPTLNTLGDRFEAEQTFKGQTIVVSVHLEAKTAYLATVLKRGGADVIVTGSNPLSTQDDVAAGLVDMGLTVGMIVLKKNISTSLTRLLIINHTLLSMMVVTW